MWSLWNVTKSCQISELLVPDWNHPENIHILEWSFPSSSVIFQRWSEIPSTKSSCWAWWEAMTPSGLLTGCWIRSESPSQPCLYPLWATVWGSVYLLGFSRFPQQHPVKRLIVYWRAGGSKEKNTSISLSSNFWWGLKKKQEEIWKNV